MNQEHCYLSFLGPCLPGAGPAAGRWWPQAGKGDREGTACSAGSPIRRTFTHPWQPFLKF